MKKKKTKKPVKKLKWFNCKNYKDHPTLKLWEQQGWVGRITLKTGNSYDVVWCQVGEGQFQFISLEGNRVTDDLNDIVSFGRFKGRELGIVKCE